MKLINKDEVLTGDKYSYLITLNAKRMEVINRTHSPAKKIISAAFSSFLLRSDCPRIERKERMQLNIKRIMAAKVISSIIDCSDFPSSLIDVRIRKQMPSKLDDVFKICGDLSG